MKKEPRNYAFIDGQNLNLGVQALGWQLDWGRFRVYLRDKYGVARAYYFIGYIPGNESLYRRLQTAGYTLEFKPVLIPQSGEPKGNIDADLVLRAMIDYDAYEKAVIVSSDGDFYSLVKHLYGQGKLETVLSPYRQHCSALLKREAKERIEFLNSLRRKLEYRKPRR